MGNPRFVRHVCIDCGVSYYRKQVASDPNRCTDCAIEYDIDVVRSQAGASDEDALARKYRGLLINRPSRYDVKGD